MTERFILTEQFNGLQSVPFVKDECVDVDTYYTVDGAVDLLNQLNDENEQLKQIIYEDESQIIGEWSSHIQEDMKELNEAYESDDINDLIRFCTEG